MKCHRKISAAWLSTWGWARKSGNFFKHGWRKYYLENIREKLFSLPNAQFIFSSTFNSNFLSVKMPLIRKIVDLLTKRNCYIKVNQGISPSSHLTIGKNKYSLQSIQLCFLENLGMCLLHKASCKYKKQLYLIFI